MGTYTAVHFERLNKGIEVHRLLKYDGLEHFRYLLRGLDHLYPGIFVRYSRGLGRLKSTIRHKSRIATHPSTREASTFIHFPKHVAHGDSVRHPLDEPTLLVQGDDTVRPDIYNDCK